MVQESSKPFKNGISDPVFFLSFESGLLFLLVLNIFEINMDYINYISRSDYYNSDDVFEEKMEDVTYQYGYIENIINFDLLTEITNVLTTMEIDTFTQTLKSVVIDDGRRNYKKYTPEQARLFIQIMQDESTFVPETALRCNISRQSAYTLLKEFNANDGSFALKAKNRGTKQKLFPEHTQF